MGSSLTLLHHHTNNTDIFQHLTTSFWLFTHSAHQVQPFCDAIDLNLGCPQRIAHSGHFGSYLLGTEDRAIVVSIVKTLSTRLDIPVFCKIRLLETVDETAQLCRDLVAAGCKLIAVHARCVSVLVPSRKHRLTFMPVRTRSQP